MIEQIIAKLYKKSLLLKGNVVGMGTGLKIKDGLITDKTCILVGVSKKLHSGRTF